MTEDRIVTLLSQWLARHVDDAALRTALDAAEKDALDPEQAEAVEYLIADLDERPPRAQLEVAVRETLEAIALGA
jgi:hypothetical protein